MDRGLKLVSGDKLYGQNAPFPFGERTLQQDTTLFGVKRPVFKFEHIASAFETTPKFDEMHEDDSGIESEMSTISPGSVMSLPSPPVAVSLPAPM